MKSSIQFNSIQPSFSNLNSSVSSLALLPLCTLSGSPSPSSCFKFWSFGFFSFPFDPDLPSDPLLNHPSLFSSSSSDSFSWSSLITLFFIPPLPSLTPSPLLSDPPLIQITVQMWWYRWTRPSVKLHCGKFKLKISKTWPFKLGWDCEDGLKRFLGHTSLPEHGEVRKN